MENQSKTSGSSTSLLCASPELQFIPIHCTANKIWFQISKEGLLQHHPDHSLLECLNAVIEADDGVVAPIAKYIKGKEFPNANNGSSMTC